MTTNSNGGSHVNALCNTLSKLCGWFYKIRYYIPAAYRITLYNSYICSKVLYGLSVYGSASGTCLHPLHVVVNRILRSLQFLPRDTNLNILYYNYKTLPISHLYKLELLKLVYLSRYKAELLPPIISNIFVKDHSHVHKYETRSKSNLMLYRSNEATHKSFGYKAITLWNSLPSSLKHASSIKYFTIKTKQYISANKDCN